MGLAHPQARAEGGISYVPGAVRHSCAAPQTRDRPKLGASNGPGSASQREEALRCARDTRVLELQRLDGQFSCQFGGAQPLAQDVPIGTAQVSLAQLSERSRDIFR